ncbi:hypothetical protein ZHAS_00019698 [Anopheles sinensis]|uniref:Uncharacterized protein n=1 Tax=Anopheles sinensis TaxID=74873 RepID=A0A084WMD6_ANOSI|nr:hypothetical protein ZHAS_00019698 [Anopheles sinensis]
MEGFGGAQSVWAVCVPCVGEGSRRRWSASSKEEEAVRVCDPSVVGLCFPLDLHLGLLLRPGRNMIQKNHGMKRKKLPSPAKQAAPRGGDGGGENRGNRQKTAYGHKTTHNMASAAAATRDDCLFV